LRGRRWSIAFWIWKATIMITASQAAIAAYVHAMMDFLDPASPPGRRLTYWLRSNQCMVGLDFQAATTTRTSAGRKRKPLTLEKPLPNHLWARLKSGVAKSATEGAGCVDAVAANLVAFANAVNLDPLEADILQFVFYTDFDATFERLCTDIVETRAIDTLGLTSLCIRRKPTEVWDRLLRGPLNELRLVDVAGGSNGGDRFTFYVPYRIVRALTPPSETVADMERQLIGEPLLPTLDPPAYDHVAQERDFVLRLLRGAEGRKGINILLYGGPGTGKSEFCKMVAREVGRDLFAVGETDECGEEPSRNDRLAGAARHYCCSMRWRTSCSAGSAPLRDAVRCAAPDPRCSSTGCSSRTRFRYYGPPTQSTSSIRRSCGA
jgi:transitional endoplasmic reticulum ATPase